MKTLIVFTLLFTSACASTPMTDEQREAWANAFQGMSQIQYQPYRAPARQRRTVCNTYKLGYSYQTQCEQE